MHRALLDGRVDVDGDRIVLRRGARVQIQCRQAETRNCKHPSHGTTS